MAESVKAGEEKAALALARGDGIARAARAARVSQRTLYRWREDAAFAARVTVLRAAMLERATGQLADLSAAAAKKLGELLADEPRVALAAAKTVLDSACRLRELLDIDERVSRLERAANGPQAGQGGLRAFGSGDGGFGDDRPA